MVRKRCSRTQLLTYAPNMRVQVIGMEACSGSHFLWRALRAQGHDVRLVPAQYVKPYIKTNKSDYIDAESIAEAVQRPSYRWRRHCRGLYETRFAADAKPNQATCKLIPFSDVSGRYSQTELSWLSLHRRSNPAFHFRQLP